MIKEDYCSSEITRILKEKGFPTGENKWADPEAEWKVQQSVVLKWLRDEHKIFIGVDTDYDEGHIGYYPDIWYIKSPQSFIRVRENPCPQMGFDTHEEAVDSAVLWALKNLVPTVITGSSWFEMTPEQLDKLHAMAKPRSKEAIAKAEERKRKREADLLDLPMARDEEAERAAKRFYRKYPLTEGTLKAIGVSQKSAAHYQEGCFLRGVEWADRTMIKKVCDLLGEFNRKQFDKFFGQVPIADVTIDIEQFKQTLKGD